MLHAVVQMFLYGLLAGLSPLAFGATIAVTQAGRLKALGFGMGFVAAQSLTCSLFVVIGVAATGAGTKRPGVQAVLAVALALALGAVALRIRRRPLPGGDGSSERTRALLERIGRFRLVTTTLAGLLLGIGGPKRLVLTALAATTITTAALHDSGEATLVVLYVALATAVVWGPVILFVLLGERGVSLMERAQGEVARRQPKVTVYALLLLAALLALDGITALLTQVR